MGDKLIEARKHIIDGNMLALQGMLDEAIIKYTAAIIISPDFTGALWARGLTYYRLNKLKKARADFQRCVDIDPGWIEYHRMLGLIHWDLGDLQGAISSFSKAIDLAEGDSERVGALCGRGEVWASFGEHEAAVSDFDHALRLDPISTHAYSCRSFSFYILGRYESALADCDKLIELSEKEQGIIGGYRLRRAIIYDALGYEHKAHENIRAAVRAGIPASAVGEIMEEYKYSRQLSPETIDRVFCKGDDEKRC